MKIMTSIAAALAAIAVAAGSAAANEGPTRWTKTAELSSYPQVSRLAQGQCTLIVSNCEICRLLDDGSATCSTPGFACLPTRWSCMRYAKEHGPPAPDD